MQAITKQFPRVWVMDAHVEWSSEPEYQNVIDVYSFSENFTKGRVNPAANNETQNITTINCFGGKWMCLR
jgi:hypothetical protein